jgi:uncharacterized DUF497 family protein
MEAPLAFEWDEDKADANVTKHGVPFPFGIRVFLDEAYVSFDVSREGEGEERHKVVGRIGDKLFTVVITTRGLICRVISARRANKQEERIYGTRPHDI